MKTQTPWAVFLDIDGTLLGNSSQLSKRNALAIKKAQAAGHYVFINTGRALGNIPEEFYDFIPLANGLIAGSGTYIEYNKKVFLDAHLDNDTVKEICDYVLKRKDLWAVFECKTGIIGVNSVPAEWGVKKFAASKNDFDTKFKDETVEVTAIGKMAPDDFYTDFGDRMNIIQMRDFADCIVNGCSKSNGMKTVLKELNIPIERSIAIGDSENDIDMLKSAGVSVAVANASKKVIDIADMITDKNINDGVAKAIEKLLNV